MSDRRRISKRPVEQTGSEAEEEKETKIVVNWEKLASEALVAAVSGISTAVAIRSLLGNK